MLANAKSRGDEAWLIGEHRMSGEKKYYLANLPANTDLRTLATTIRARWVCEQAHQQMKEELGLDHFEGRSWQGLHRVAGSGPCTSTDAIDPVPVDLLRAQIKAELLAHHASEEAAHRMLLPMGDAHNGGNRRPLRSAQHGEHASLFRPWPAFARGASFALRLARPMPRPNGRLRCNRSSLARGDDFDCRG